MRYNMMFMALVLSCYVSFVSLVYGSANADELYANHATVKAFFARPVMFNGALVSEEAQIKKIIRSYGVFRLNHRLGLGIESVSSGSTSMADLKNGKGDLLKFGIRELIYDEFPRLDGIASFQVFNVTSGGGVLSPLSSAASINWTHEVLSLAVLIKHEGFGGCKCSQ